MGRVNLRCIIVLASGASLIYSVNSWNYTEQSTKMKSDQSYTVVCLFPDHSNFFYVNKTQMYMLKD